MPGRFLQERKMTRTVQLLSIISSLFLVTTLAYGSSVEAEIKRVAKETAGLELGFNNYHLGSVLTEAQKKVSETNAVEKALHGTYKFKDNDVYVVASDEDDTILGIYKEYPNISMEELKGVVGGLMFEFGEPTVMAHNKLIYWSYDKNGKITQDEFEFARQSGGAQSLATVKLSSSESIGVPVAPENKEAQGEQNDSSISAYVIITSDPLSKLFLARSQQSGKVEKK